MSITPTLRKKRVTKPKVKSVIESELECLFNEIDDVELKEPIAGSPFIRRGFVECISNDGFEDLLILTKTYQVNELHMNEEQLFISCEDGDHHWIPSKHLRAIDYGPFKEHDQVALHGWANVETIQGEQDDGLLGATGVVELGDDTNAIVVFGRGHKFKIPNVNLRLKRRHLQLGKNPFKTGDRVRAIRDRASAHAGCLYTIKDAYDDYVHLVEDRDGDRYYHSMFKKYDKLSKKEKLKSTMKKTLSLEDYIRKFYNEYSYEKLTPSKLIKYMKESKVPKELLDEEQIIKTLKTVNKTVFHW